MQKLLLPVPLTYDLPNRDWYETTPPGTKSKKKQWASKDWTKESRAIAELGRVKNPLHGTTLPAPSFNLQQYINEVNQIPVLTLEEEQALAHRFYNDETDLDAARQLVMAHLRVVVAMSRKYNGYGLPQADLIQEGNIGLMKAVKRFNPNKNVRLVSFALHWIRAEIHEYIIRNWRLVRVATTKNQRKLFFNLRRIKAELKQHGNLTKKQVNKVAKMLNVYPEEVSEMEGRFSGRYLPVGDDEESFDIADSSETPPELLSRLEEEDLASTSLKQALSQLDPRSRTILEQRYLREKPLTLQAIGNQFNISAERVRQIEVKALEALKHEFVN